MIAALKNERFYHIMQLKEIGVPSYITDSMEEPQLLSMLANIRYNPWAYYDKETNFTINICAKIAEKYNVNNEIEKCKAYLQYSIDRIANDGHCYAHEWQVNNILKEHNFSDYNRQYAIDRLQRIGVLFVSDKNNYFLSKYFDAEIQFARLLKDYNKLNNRFTGFKKQYQSSIYSILNEKQKEVVDSLENNSLIILTGLPGTGKTTTIKAIVETYGHENIELFAPTGKAASRMSELCDMDARTLHSYFYANEFGANKLIQNKIVIIDELSMCGSEIMGLVSRGIGDGCVLLLVGDPDQLPSVDPGQVLKDILASSIGVHYHLNVIMRQRPGSIIKSAHAIHSGKNIVTDDDNEVLIYNPSVWNIERITHNIVTNKHWKDAQFLSVLKNNGSVVINNIVQNALNPSEDNGFRVKDKIIHIKNNLDLGVMNGEMGIVVKKNDRILTVQYKDKVIQYPNALLWQLEHAYCITIHKSQGSEFRSIVMFVQPSKILNQNILYTGLTRAREKVLIVTPSTDVLLEAIQNKQKSRQTSLKYLLKDNNGSKH